MKPIIMVLLLVAAGYAQDARPTPLPEYREEFKLSPLVLSPDPRPTPRPSPTPSAQASVQVMNDWKYVASGANKTTWFYKTWSRNSQGDVEAWLKIVTPPNSKVFTGIRNAKYFLLFHVFHCDDNRVSTEGSVAYRQNDTVIASERLLSRTYREPIVPDSVMETIFRFFCK